MDRSSNDIVQQNDKTDKPSETHTHVITDDACVATEKSLTLFIFIHPPSNAGHSVRHN